MPNAATADSNHDTLFRNVAALRQALADTAAESHQDDDDRGAETYLFWAEKLGEVARGSSLQELFTDLELVYRRTTAMAVQATRAGATPVAMACLHSAHMLIRMLRPDLGEDEAQEQVFASLERREEELEV